MKKVLLLMGVAVMVLGLTFSAQAVPTINDPWAVPGGAEKNLYQIFADPLFNGGSFLTSQAIANTLPISETFPGGIPFKVTAYATYASFQQDPGSTFSNYPVGSPGSGTVYFSSFTAAFPANTDGIYAITDWTVNTFTNGVIGLFDDTTASNGDIKYTEKTLNSGVLSQSNGLIFKISDCHYIVAFEDGAGASSLGDYDYNDLVLNVVTCPSPTPIPGSLLLLGSGLLGVIGLRRKFNV